MSIKKDLYPFRNDSNMCYFISSLQILLTNNEFKNIIINAIDYKDPHNIIEITKSIINSRIIVENKHYRCHEVNNPYILKYAFSKINIFFESSEQQDSQECFIHMIDIYSKIITIKKSKDQEQLLFEYHNKYTKEFCNKYVKYLKEYYKKNSKSPIMNIFNGVYRSTKICNHCNKKEIDFEMFDNTYIIPKNGESILRCFLKQFELEEVELRCESCKKEGFKKEITFMTFPKNLILCVKRFDQTTFNSSIPIEKQFSMKTNGYSFSYRLKLIIHHQGSNMNGGHYYITMDDLLINDSKIDILKESFILQGSNTAYMILYELM